ncbi:Na+/H+ antiporter NhaA [Microbacteriaceae bacterium SG_E_30_P1]|uniref:Na(+)/H(+) antiporter NhaA n=1 Tax=Antiquaquibacter oligotrophicus TaxID=2880260 RepID=A0ABT6KQH9_9MICO|nr:Na+/H+ antiporter NhaA [Antiquaquibacter oligotrophicus]MDH6182241.1 Na+/H+ antiporter NhaA [Antiquaquibacter oligotrophicus]UDF12100.1 Na+/H+ antiporter NhaA [Antiquaquibacter oligotrophicus]
MSLTITDTSSAADPERGRSHRRHPTIAEKVRALGEVRIGALLLVIATIVAIVWANLPESSYHHFWETHLVIGLEDLRFEFTLHALVNDALMAIFFFSVGLEVRREFAIGELTKWSRAIIPVTAAIAGLAVPAIIFVLFNLDSGQAHAWGIVISTDTAFLVGALALIGPRAPGRLRLFLLTLAVVDDIGALSIIAFVYTENFAPLPLVVGAVGLAGIYLVRYLQRGRGPIYVTLAIIVWMSFLASGVHPTLAGVAIALLIPVYRPDRRDVEQALDLAHMFRQSPNSEYARQAANSLRESISINERLQSAYAPYIAFVILPLFALANAGVEISPEILAAAAMSPITWGIVAGLVAGKFVGVYGASAVLKYFKLGDFGPGLTLGRIAGGAALCGIGFTISLFIVDLAIDDPAAQNEARVGVLAASVIALILATIVFRITDGRRSDEEIGAVLARPIDPAKDHTYGRPDAPLTLVEYGDFQCPFCSKASGSIEELRANLGDDLLYVWRHAPLIESHPNALAAAEAAEAAGLQGAFPQFSRSLFSDQDHQLPRDMMRRAEELGLDVEKFANDLRSPEIANRVQDDVLDAEAMDITSVPTFFVNGRRHTGPWDAPTLARALRGEK